MNAHHIQTMVGPNGTLTLKDIPFQPGEQVEVIILEHAVPLFSGEKDRYPLRDKPIRYDAPFAPVAEKEWDVLQ